MAEPGRFVSADLQQCNSEPVSLIGGVQPHGCALFFTKSDHRVQIVSENAMQILRADQPVLGAKIEHIFDKKFVDEIMRMTSVLDREAERGVYLETTFDGEKLVVYLYETEGLFGLEIEPQRPVEDADAGPFPTAPFNSDSRLDLDRNLREFMARARQTNDVAKLAKVACATIREILGFDRVMMYKFLPPDWHGEVIAEDRVIQAHSYDGHRFPASDIPRPARDLYLRNRTRVIADSTAELIPLNPPIHPLTRKPIDLSDSRLRAVSSVHLEYLRNMGVRASFSFAVTFENRLWGLIACHNSRPSTLAPRARAECELVASFLSAQVPLIESNRDAEEQLKFHARMATVFDAVSPQANPIDHLFRLHQDIGSLFGASGIAYVQGARVDFAGLTPARADLVGLATWINDQLQGSTRATGQAGGQRLFETNALSSLDSRWEPLRSVASGVLAVQTEDVPPGLFLIFRPEVIRTITWGGDPRKQLDKKNFAGRIHPRASFEAWEEVIGGSSTEWRAHELTGAIFIRDRIFGLLAKKDRLIQELNDELRTARRRS